MIAKIIKCLGLWKEKRRLKNKKPIRLTQLQRQEASDACTAYWKKKRGPREYNCYEGKYWTLNDSKIERVEDNVD